MFAKQALDEKGRDWLGWLARQEDESREVIKREAQERANNPRRFRRAARRVAK